VILILRGTQKPSGELLFHHRTIETWMLLIAVPILAFHLDEVVAETNTCSRDELLNHWLTISEV
jgi:hypothetical protein